MNAADAGFESTLEGLTAMELMDKKDSIESDIKEFIDILESVSYPKSSCWPNIPPPLPL